MAMRDWFIKDLGWKIFSVVLAGGIWLTVHKIRNESETIGPTGFQAIRTFVKVPLLIVSEAADVRDFHVKPAEVAVIVSGPPDDIARFQVSQIRAFVDLTGIQPAGDLKRPVEVSMPSGLMLVGVEPTEVDAVVPPPHNKTP